MTHRTLGTLVMAWALAIMPAPILLASAVDESVAQAKALYESAAFAEALAVLANNTSPEGYQYRALCLLALGRVADAERELAGLVTVSPTFVVLDEDVPPRFVAMFAETKRRVIPALARQLFEQARQNFQDKSYQRALEGFERVSALASERALNEVDAMKDLALLASGFVDLARSAVASSTPAPPVQPSESARRTEGAVGAGDRAPGPATTRPSFSATAAAAEERAGIQATLDMYAGGYSNLDAAAVKRVYPGIDEKKLQRGFGAYRSQQVEVQVEQIQMTGPTTADVTTLQMTTASMQVGGMHRDTRRILFRLERRSGSWIIVEHR